MTTTITPDEKAAARRAKKAAAERARRARIKAEKETTTPAAATPRVEVEYVVEVSTATCRFCGEEKTVDSSNFYAKRDGGFYTNGRCKSCEKTLRDGYRAKKAETGSAR